MNHQRKLNEELEATLNYYSLLTDFIKISANIDTRFYDTQELTLVTYNLIQDIISSHDLHMMDYSVTADVDFLIKKEHVRSPFSLIQSRFFLPLPFFCS